MKSGIAFEDRAVLAVVGALAGTTSYQIRGVAVRVDAEAASADVMFAAFEATTDSLEGIEEFSARLDASASSWLSHTTSHWSGPSLDIWPGRHERVLLATRDPDGGWGIGPADEYRISSIFRLAVSLPGLFGSEVWGVSLDVDWDTLTLDIHIGSSKEFDRLDRYALELLCDGLNDQQLRSELWQAKVWIGEIGDYRDWPGRDHRKVYLRRMGLEAPDYFERD